MKQFVFILGLMVACTCFSGCSNDDDSLSHEENSAFISKQILGKWDLVKAIPESDNCLGFNYLHFYPDGTFKCNNIRESKEYQGKYEIIVNDYSENIVTADNSSLQTNYHLLLYYGEDYYLNPLFIFVIKGDIMHLYIPYTYLHNAYKFKHVEVP